MSHGTATAPQEQRQSKAQKGGTTVKEATGAIGIPANGATRDMAATGSDRGSSVKERRRTGRQSKRTGNSTHVEDPKALRVWYKKGKSSHHL
jgi:hypothetical protein